MTHLPSLRDNQTGATAIIFALASLSIFAMAGAAIDFNRFTTLERSLQASVDAAALAVARSAETTVEGRTAVARSVVVTNFKQGSRFEDLDVQYALDGADFVVTASATMETALLGVIGIDEMALNSQAGATRETGLSKPLEFVFMLDTTASMSVVSGSWEDAKDEVKWAFGQLASAGTDSASVDMTFAGIGDRVNVGTDKTSWLNGPAPAGWNGCMEPRYSVVTDASDPETYDTEAEQSFVDHYNASGASFDYVLTDAGPSFGKFTASQPGVVGGLAARSSGYPHCTSEIVGPTDDVTALNLAVDTSTPAGTGRFDLAISWAWRLVSPRWEGEWGKSGYPAPHDEADKVIAIVTDSHSTAWDWEAGGSGGSRPPGLTYNEVSDEGFEQIKQVCEQVKADGVQVYVILVNSYSRAANPWTACASPGKFYTVTTLADFKSAVNSLVTDILAVRLTG